MRLCKEEIKVLKKENANLKEQLCQAQRKRPRGKQEGDKQATKSKTLNAQMASTEEGEDDEIVFANCVC